MSQQILQEIKTQIEVVNNSTAKIYSASLEDAAEYKKELDKLFELIKQFSGSSSFYVKTYNAKNRYL